jgi:hypothetical protein
VVKAIAKKIDLIGVPSLSFPEQEALYLNEQRNLSERRARML